MVEPSDLYTLRETTRPTSTPVLIVHFSGFMDAGNVGEVMVDTLEERNKREVVAEFDVDRLVDMRARRPRMLYERDGWRTFEEPALTLRRMTDAAGTGYLLLTGPEPDRYWEAFVAAVIELIDHFSVRLVLTANGIPTAVPHTRPIGHTEHATDPELLTGTGRGDLDSVEVPGSVGALLEFRLGESGIPAAGVAVHVPHYLAGSRYSEGALYAMERLGAMSGLSLPVAALAEPVMADREAIAAEVAGSEDIGRVVDALEQGFDEAERQRQLADAEQEEDAEDSVDLISADEIGAQVEEYLRRQSGPDDEPGQDQPDRPEGADGGPT